VTITAGSRRRHTSPTAAIMGAASASIRRTAAGASDTSEAIELVSGFMVAPAMADPSTIADGEYTGMGRLCAAPSVALEVPTQLAP
jgi:hypothetical protein